jgi:hypothetical protein
VTTASKIIQAAFREGNLIPVGIQPTTNQLAEALDKLNRLVTGILGYKMGENLSDWMAPQPQRTAPVAANFPQFPLGNDFTVGGFGLGPDLPSNVYPYPPINQRIIFGGHTQTVYFPEAPNPGSQMAVVQGTGAGDGGSTNDVLTLDGNGRLIQDPADGNFKTQVTFTFNSVTPFTPARWFYRDDLAQWLLVQPLTSGSGATYTDNLPYPPEFDDFFNCALAKRLAPSYGKITAQETIQTALDTERAFLARYRQPTVTVYGSDQFPRSYMSYINGNWWWALLMCIGSGGLILKVIEGAHYASSVT